MKTNKIIDTTLNSFNDSEFLRIFHEIFEESYKEFSKNLDNISAIYSNNLHWWISLTASRNAIKNNIYREFCIIKTMQKIDQIDDVSNSYIISSDSTRIAIENCFGKNCPVLIVKKSSAFSTKKFRDFLRPKYYFFKKLTHMVLIRILFSKPALSESSTLVETFLSPSENENRYYPNYDQFLDKDLKMKILFVPTIINTNFFSTLSIFYKTLKGKNKYLFRESFLNIFDLIASVRYRKEYKKIVINSQLKKLDRDVIDLEILVEGSLKDEAFNSLSAEGLLNFRFIKNLKTSNCIDTFHYVDWWENTPMDKGLNLALNRFYPEAKSTGYMGFVPNQLSFELSPTQQELIANVLPNTIGVIGEAFLPILTRCNSDIEGTIAPAFRFAYLNDMRISGKKYFLVLPSIDREEWNELLQIIIFVATAFPEMQFIIKPHPGMGSFKKNFNLPNIEIDHNSEVKKLIQHSEILITSTSSAAIEAIVKSVPTLIFQSSNSIPKNIIPSTLDKAFWRNFSNQNNLLTTIKELLEGMDNDKNVIKLSRYFNLPNKQNVYSFFKK